MQQERKHEEGKGGGGGGGGVLDAGTPQPRGWGGGPPVVDAAYLQTQVFEQGTHVVAQTCTNLDRPIRH